MDDRYDPLTGRIRDRERYRRGRGMDEPNMNFPEMAVAKCLPARNREFDHHASTARTEPARARSGLALSQSKTERRCFEALF